MIPSIQIFLLLLTFYMVKTEQAPKLIFIEEIFRHGARLPFRILFPKINDLFAQQQMSRGELTNQGKSMHYLLGKKMYQTYWNKLFGGTPYQYNYNQSRFYVMSSDTNRTIESAQSHLYGLLESLSPLTISQEQAKFSSPPYPGVKAKAGYVFGQKSKFYHSIAVHSYQDKSTPLEQGNFLTTFLQSNCPNQKKWMDQNRQDKQGIQMQSIPSFISSIRELQIQLNLPKDTINIENFFGYIDALTCLKFYNKPVPSSLIKPSQTKRSLYALKSLNSFIKFYGNEQQRRASSTGFFQQTIKNINNAISNKDSPQWIIYSAHDITIGHILAMMNMWNAKCIYENYLKNISDPDTCVTTFPGYATLMVFEIYEYSDKTYTFRVNYNGRYLTIPFCDYKTECEVSKLESWFASWKVNSVVQACGATSNTQH